MCIRFILKRKIVARYVIKNKNYKYISRIFNNVENN